MAVLNRVWLSKLDERGIQQIGYIDNPYLRLSFYLE